MQLSNEAATRQVVDANAVIVRNAFLGSMGPLSGVFEVFDPDYCVRPQPDGLVHITVTCSIQGDLDADATLELSAQQWECLAVIGYDGPVISQIARP